MEWYSWERRMVALISLSGHHMQGTSSMPSALEREPTKTF